jgi:hypothetical protein
MLKPPRLSPSIVIASVALFVSLGGTGYAISTIKGSAIAKNSIPGNRVTSNSLTGTQIKESALAIVPSATHALSADSATTATSATHAATADSATNAGHASTADSATNAGHASTADSATNAAHATAADSATSAGHASTADSATSATSATTASALTGFDFTAIRYSAPTSPTTPAVILNDFDGLTLTAQCDSNGMSLTARSATANSAIGISETHGAGNGNAAELDESNLTNSASGAVIMGSAPGVSSVSDETGEIVFQQADPSAQVKGGTVTIDYLYTINANGINGCVFVGNATGHPGA